VSTLYLYALVDAIAAGPSIEGAWGETVEPVLGGGVVAAVGTVERAPEPGLGAGSEAMAVALRKHDAVVRRLSERASAILPVRFGTVSDRPELLRWLVEHGKGLCGALAAVRGCEQMTLRVFAESRSVSESMSGSQSRSWSADGVEGRVGDAGADATVDSAPSGAAYLRARAAEKALPDLEPLRAALGAMVRAEKVERHRTPPLLATAYHLVPRGSAHAYREAVEGLAAGPMRLAASGPFAPYAFGAEVGTP
jgi:hypothetical protein